MIVLDEQLLGYDLEGAVGKWYPGAVIPITQLRPHTLIPDEAMPVLLRTARQPLFITLNVSDFWQRLAPDPGFGIACFALLQCQAREVSPWLRRLFKLAPFQTRNQRLGKIVRVSRSDVQFYTLERRAIQRIEWSK